MSEQGKRQTRLDYAEMLIGKALEFNRKRSKTAKKVREALLLVALRELQAKEVKPGCDPQPRSK